MATDSTDSPLKPSFCAAGWLPRALSAPPALLPSFATADEQGMAAAIVAAMAAVGRSAPNPGVGCVLVKDGRIIAEGATEVFGGRHAEAVALAQAGDAATGATAYVTLEPCAHQGKQGPCSEALVAAGIRRCVIGVRDPHPQVAGKGIKILADAGVEVAIGVLAEECAALHAPFLLQVQQDRPFVAVKWAQTLDGQMADGHGESQWITGSVARAYGHWLRQLYDVIVVGAGTAIADRPALTVRDCAEPHARQPTKLIWDPSGRLQQLSDAELQELKSRTFSGALIYASVNVDEQWASNHLPASGQAVTVAGSSIAELAKLLRSESLANAHGGPVQSVMIEGGPRLIQEITAAGSFDRAHVFIAPATLGAGGNGIAQPARTMAHIQRWPILAHLSLASDLGFELLGPGHAL